MRPEDGRERRRERRTSNCLARILAELRSWDRNQEPNLLHLLETSAGTRGAVTRTEESTGFNLSTDTESNLSPTWRTKLLAAFEDLLRASEEQWQWRFRGIVTNKHKPSCQEGLRQRLRVKRRDHMMMWRPRESTFRKKTSEGNSKCSINLPGRDRGDL